MKQTKLLTQSNPIQSNPWMNPIHVQLWVDATILRKKYKNIFKYSVSTSLNYTVSGKKRPPEHNAVKCTVYNISQ